jgi:hypothetical protein
MPTNCNLQPTPADLDCDFKGKPGDVTLVVKGTIGEVLIESAVFNDVTVPGLPSSELPLTLKTGSNRVTIVYAFSGAPNGRGELREKCDGNTLLDREIWPDDPAKSYVICCTEEPQ